MSTGVDGERKSAFYDYKQEKTLRQTDAKLFFQQQQQQGAGQSGWNSPVLRSASTWGGGGAISKTGSVRSFTSSHHHHSALPFHPFFAGGAPTASRSHTPGISAATGLASFDKAPEHSQVQGAGMGRFDPHGILDTASSAPRHIIPTVDGKPIEPKGGYAASKFTNQRTT
jgi:AMP deaminase